MRLPAVLIIILFPFALASQNFPEPPDPPRLVNDLAQMLSERERQSLESKLVAFNDSTSSQIAIVTIPSLEGYDVADYSFELAEYWGIGQQGQDNGILILIAPTERKMFIATGYGVEAFVPDAIAKRIVEGTLKPNFRNQDYYRGLDQATNLLIGLLSGQFSPQQLEEEKPLIPILLVILIFLIVLFLIIKLKIGSGGLRGGTGGHTYMGPMRGGSTWSDFSSGSGTFGGGGFGGFSGGSFGGGGAGGSW